MSTIYEAGAAFPIAASSVTALEPVGDDTNIDLAAADGDWYSNLVATLIGSVTTGMIAAIDEA
jgi:hypothetical protein